MSLPHSVWTCYRALHPHLADSPAATAEWLTAAELGELAHWNEHGRRQQWLQARRLAKQLIQHASGAAHLRDVQVLSRDARGLGVAPSVSVTTGAAPRSATWQLSISHSDRGILLALAPSGEYLIGVDLVASVPADRRFENTWFTADERRLLEADRRVRTAQLWAIKEAVYKAVGGGDDWSPRHVEVLAIEADSARAAYRGQPLDRLQIERRQIDGQTAVTACLPVHSLETVTTVVPSAA